MYYSPISIDTVHEHEDFGALIMTVLQEYLQVQELQAAFPAETQIEENFEQGTLDRVLDDSGKKKGLIFFTETLNRIRMMTC